MDDFIKVFHKASHFGVYIFEGLDSNKVRTILNTDSNVKLKIGDTSKRHIFSPLKLNLNLFLISLLGPNYTKIASCIKNLL